MSGSTTFSFSLGGTDFNWDTSSNWTPAGIDLGTQGTTQFDDSIVMGDNGVGPYTAFVGAAAGVDKADNINITYSGATLATNDSNVQLQFAGTFALAGTLALSNNMEVLFVNTPAIDTSTGVGDLYDNGLITGAGVIASSVNVILGTGSIVANAATSSDGINSLSIGAAIQGTIALTADAGANLIFGNAVAASATVGLSATSNAEIDDLQGFAGTVSGLQIDTTSQAISFNGGAAIGSSGLPTDLTGNFIDVAGLDATNNPLDVNAAAGGLVGSDFSATFTFNTVATTGGTIDLFDTATGTPGLLGTIVVSGDFVGDTLNVVSDGSDNSLSTLNSQEGVDLFFTCFLPGTHISTPNGEIAVEALSAGDQVVVIVDGQRVSRPVKWVGYRKLALDRRAIAAAQGPIRIKCGAMAEGLPARDLLVSSAHCMFLDGKLIPAKLLVNDMTIVRETEMRSVEYYHVELDQHSILLAEGVETESYLDTGNRAFFSNAGLALMLHPEFHVNAGLRCWATDACAPLAVSPAAVLPVWRELADRAAALGYVPPTHATTTEADIHLVADGRRIDTIAVNGQVHSFMVPAGVKSLALASRSVVPNVLVRYLDDPREIGVAVRGITIRGMAGRAEFSADHPALARGWHAPERADGAVWRWTKGHGTLPVGVVSGPVVVDVMVSETTTYLIDDAPAEGRLAA